MCGSIPSSCASAIVAGNWTMNLMGGGRGPRLDRFAGFLSPISCSCRLLLLPTRLADLSPGAATSSPCSCRPFIVSNEPSDNMLPGRLSFRAVHVDCTLLASRLICDRGDRSTSCLLFLCAVSRIDGGRPECDNGGGSELCADELC